MKKRITGDGSETFYSEEFKECYHSVTGAKEEAVKKFVEPTNIKELAKEGKVRILDVCFGLGYNTAAALDLILKVNSGCEVGVVGLEKDKKIINKIQEVESGFDSYGLIKEVKGDNLEVEKDNIKIKIILGDALKTIKKVEGKFDICFLDPFSPKKCSELWQESFLKDVFCLMKKGGYLTTYSCARLVRDNLKKAGFKVKDGPRVGRRAPATIGIKSPSHCFYRRKKLWLQK